MFHNRRSMDIDKTVDYNSVLKSLTDELKCIKRKVEVLEENRTDIYNRLDSLISSYDKRFAILEENRTDLYHRMDDSMGILRRTGLSNVYSKIDYRISRLEVLKYYSVEENYQKLDVKCTP